jgi:hypothetical protein
MTIEAEIALLTTATTTLTTNHTASKDALDLAVAGFAATTATVDGLNNVDNTSDANKPVSTAQQTESDTKQDTLINGTNMSTINGNDLLAGFPISIPVSPIDTETYDNRANIKALTPVVKDSMAVEGIGIFQFVSTQLEPQDDETCFNVDTGGQWLLTVPANDLLSAWALVGDSVRDNLDEDEEIRFNQYLTTQGVI